MNHLLEKEGLVGQVVCDSAGTSAYHIGEPPDRRMTAAAQKRGIPMRGRARQFTPQDFEAFDLILVMDRDNLEAVSALDRASSYRDKVKLMCEFCTQHSFKEVPDPYYGGPAGFDQVITLLEDACAGLLTFVKQQI